MVDVEARRRLLHGPPDDDEETCCECGADAPTPLCAGCEPAHVHRFEPVRKMGGRFWRCRCGEHRSEVSVI